MYIYFPDWRVRCIPKPNNINIPKQLNIFSSLLSKENKTKRQKSTEKKFSSSESSWTFFPWCIPEEATQRVTRNQFRFCSYFVHIMCLALLHLVPNMITGAPLESQSSNKNLHFLSLLLFWYLTMAISVIHL